MHFAVYVANEENKAKLIEELTRYIVATTAESLPLEKVVLYSRVHLHYFLQKEYQHEQFVLTAQDQPLASLSEGEQKKALLSYLLASNPRVLIVDDVYDSLDREAQQAITARLQNSAANIQIVQLFSRQRDVLPFIKQCYRWQNNTLSEFILPIYAKPALFAVPAPVNTPAPIESQPLVVLQGVSVSFDGKPVLNNVHWQINQGDFWHLIGPNGSGKSTLLSLITGDNVKAYGQPVSIFGKVKGSGESVWENKARIGYFTHKMVQNFSRYESVENMLLSGFLIRSVCIASLRPSISVQHKNGWHYWICRHMQKIVLPV